ncbi:PadR family transcriptional regulator [Enterococcus dongliensis]|uniref:PadR family transcriptional regulator n=1 Tax=Enterococcus dongliensis TaxID=2559925 RepID=A0AAP5NIX8_9ENTE|nr:PadR family transcriptional regulator [Enterococcus dongliensis]MDT2596887.1 PadR family transcriptional regulator [Enterococcus dongliensis]MDT2604780.1 PadR family transcriptional regulator [Enterococcus dongliensis]MDT2613223.1 PadR family transcriptional regulator [Enterococcus dongliensis]MDT2634711.1 PadR family transcriptional regulator [Enterococcus dongliensis]MDT2637763.1 PadR family transcriptional regulator [Enterococcus dongliensis]
MDSQLKKGLIEYCVLASLVQIDSYGYQIIKEIHPQLELTESTLYPILKRLETTKKVTTYSKIHNGRIRKYYHLTDSGFASIQKFLQDWSDVEAVYHYIKRSVEK